MLSRQQGGRHHHGDLEAFHRGDEGRTQRYLGLAEADIAADQPVHRTSGRQIVDDGINGVLLVIGLVIGEACGKLAVEPVWWCERRRATHLALGSYADQVPGHLQQPLLQLRLARLPADTAEPVQHRLGFA